MKTGLRLSLYFAVFCWLLLLVGVFLLLWCNQKEAASIALASGPCALIASVAVYIEWKTWKDSA